METYWMVLPTDSLLCVAFKLIFKIAILPCRLKCIIKIENGNVWQTASFISDFSCSKWSKISNINNIGYECRFLAHNIKRTNLKHCSFKCRFSLYFARYYLLSINIWGKHISTTLTSTTVNHSIWYVSTLKLSRQFGSSFTMRLFIFLEFNIVHRSSKKKGKQSHLL